MKKLTAALIASGVTVSVAGAVAAVWALSGLVPVWVIPAALAAILLLSIWIMVFLTLRD